MKMKTFDMSLSISQQIIKDMENTYNIINNAYISNIIHILSKVSEAIKIEHAQGDNESSHKFQKPEVIKIVIFLDHKF